MAGAEKRSRELEALGGKVYQATELINRLKESNRELCDELVAIKRRLDTQEPAVLDKAAQPSEQAPVAVPEPDPELVAAVKRLRGERLEIRERVSRLLQQIGSLEI